MYSAMSLFCCSLHSVATILCLKKKLFIFCILPVDVASFDHLHSGVFLTDSSKKKKKSKLPEERFSHNAKLGLPAMIV